MQKGALFVVQRYSLNEKKTKPIEKRENESGEEENDDEEDSKEFEDYDEERGKCLWSFLKGLN